VVFPLPSPPSSVMKMPVGFLGVLVIGDFHFSRNSWSDPMSGCGE
jgi:hypothetical protein